MYAPKDALPMQQPKESAAMIPTAVVLAVKLAMELKPAIVHLIKLYLSKR